MNEIFEYNIPNSTNDITLRYRPLTEYDAKNISIMVLDKNDTWRTVDCKTDGSYLVFPIQPDDVGFASIYTEPDYTMNILIAGIGGGVIILGIIIGIFVKKKSKIISVNNQ